VHHRPHLEDHLAHVHHRAGAGSGTSLADVTRNGRRTAMTQARPADEAGVVTKLSPRPVADTAARLTSMITAKGMKLFAVIDQAAEARQAGLELRDTTLVIFGSPAAGTPLMAAAPLAARHHLAHDLAANLAGIDQLTDALIAP